MREQDLQSQIRLTISQTQTAVCFRTNVGEAWTGESVKHNTDGSITISRPRRFQTGLPKGFSDLLCVVPVTITPEMVGSKLAISGFLEIKTEKGRVRQDQANFIKEMKSHGARAGIVRSPEEALAVLRGEK